MSEFNAEQDEVLMARAQAGEAACFAELARRYRPALLRVARGRLGRHDWAEDAVQEALLAAYKGRTSFDARRSFRAWLWTILLNACTRLWKTGRRETSAAVSTDEERAALDPATLVAKDAPPHARAADEERAAALDRLLKRLSNEQADALRLRFFGQLKFHEIAAAQGCSLLTAKNRVKWGLLRLAEFARESHFEVQHDPLR